jgi:hypothetical protein
MRVELRIPTRLTTRLRVDLVRPNPYGGETVGFMATRSAKAADTTVVTAHDYRPVSDNGYIPADDVGVRIGSAAIRSAMEWGICGQQGIWHAHAHGGRERPPMLSDTDEHDIPRLVEALTRSCPTEIHGLLLLNQNLARAEAWVPGVGRCPVVVMEVGWPLACLSGDVTSPTEDPRFARQDFLGPHATSILRGIRVGIVGVGGGGSHLSQQLAHLGVGDLTVFDPDIIEDKNLPRTVGATEQDVLDQRPKVEIAARLANSVNKAGTVQAYRVRWQNHPEEMRRCHVVIGAADTFAERRELEVACRRFLIPYIDIGMEVHPGNRPACRMAGQVLATIPGGPCMWCLGFLTEDHLAEEARKYGAAGGRPQVIWANGVLASSAVGLVVDLITGWTGQQRSGVYLTYDGNSGFLTQHPLWVERNALECPHFPLGQSGSPALVPIR